MRATLWKAAVLLGLVSGMVVGGCASSEKTAAGDGAAYYQAAFEATVSAVAEAVISAGLDIENAQQTNPGGYLILSRDLRSSFGGGEPIQVASVKVQVENKGGEATAVYIEANDSQRRDPALSSYIRKDYRERILNELDKQLPRTSLRPEE